MSSILVWVLADNPATKFYQSLGGQKVNRKLLQVGGMEFEEIAYGWDDTQILQDVETI